MTPKISTQKALMEQALKKLDEIRAVYSLFSGIDKEYIEMKLSQLHSEYAEIMSDLFKNLLTINNEPAHA